MRSFPTAPRQTIYIPKTHAVSIRYSKRFGKLALCGVLTVQKMKTMTKFAGESVFGLPRSTKF
jgi:hypothetical protein